MASDMQRVDRVIRRLEIQNRLLLVAIVALVLIAMLGAAKVPSVVRASAFELTDPAGRVRAELAVRNGAVGLYLKDETGRDRLSAWHDGETTGIYIDDDTGTTRIGVAQFAHGGGGVALHGPESRGAAVLYLKGEGSLRFFDADGSVTHSVLATGPE
jgi:hypothetical protein